MRTLFKTTLAVAALLVATPVLAIGPEETDDALDASSPASPAPSYSTRKTDTKVYAPTDNRVNAPSSVRKNTTTNSDSRSVTTVGPNTTKVGPSATTGPSTATNGPNSNSNNNASSATAGASTSSGGSIVFKPNFTIIVPNSNTTTSAATSASNQTQTNVGGPGPIAPLPGPVGPPALIPPPPVCSVARVVGLGFDALARPIALNVRRGPGTEFDSVRLPDLSALVAIDGTLVRVCGRQARWLTVEVSTAFGPARGWVFDRYVSAP